MASYVDQSLGQGETLVGRAHFHWVYTLQAVLALVLLGWLLIGIYIFFDMMIRKWTTEIGVTDQRLIYKTGLFRLDTQEIALVNIEGVKVHQGFFGRIFGYGRLKVEGTGTDFVALPDIADPIDFRRHLQSAKNA